MVGRTTQPHHHAPPRATVGERSRSRDGDDEMMWAPERRSTIMSTTRTLILMRHAKSGYPSGVRDHDRPLAERGEREGTLAGDWLRRHVPPVDAVLSSTAARARGTVMVTGVTAPLRTASEIYDATPDEILGQIRETGSAVVTLLVVGHSPGMPGLATELAGDGSLDEPLGHLRTRFPTAAVAVLETESEWPDLAYGDARLVDFHVARS
jgi:phosphohistidine phosphatase